MHIHTDPAVIAGYLEDASGFIHGWAKRIAIPENDSDIGGFLESASRQHEPVTVAGGRTGVAAGCIPQGGTILSLERLATLGPVAGNDHNHWIEVQPAVRLEELKSVARSSGLMYAPDPTERTGTLGGNVATNASGGQCFKYGTTREHVLGLEAVLATGEKLCLERACHTLADDLLRYRLASGRTLECRRPQLPLLRVDKNAAGYYSRPGMDPLDLLIGMDGTLAVITRIKLRLLPAPPGVFSLFVFFPDLSQALDCAKLLRPLGRAASPNPGLTPASLEFMDSNSLRLLRPAFPLIPGHAQALLMAEQEFTQENEEALLASWQDFLAAAGVPDNMIWLAQAPSDRKRARDFRHALPEAVNTLVRQSKLPKVGTDLAVPPEAFAGMFRVYVQSLQASSLEHLIFGHIGECHLHVNVLPRNEAELLQAKALYLDFAREAVRLGGTVSAEHGIGKLKHDFLKIMVGEDGLREMARVKRCFDPSLILNRGNIFPEEYLEETR
ncbi:FAD-binding oxidoreductase [candidate division FCPU426 bacterium]|nr:FAD-binding oxidoreductase [candidate division FCPU426 bacterium]